MQTYHFNFRIIFTEKSLVSTEIMKIRLQACDVRATNRHILFSKYF